MKTRKKNTALQVEVEPLNSAVAPPPAETCPVAAPASGFACPVVRCAACVTGATFVPDYAIPLLAPGGGDHNPAILEKLGPLAALIGTWVSPSRNGYNVMPIPQATAPNGFILKNFSYYEVMTFSAIQGKVANRGGTFEQDCYTIFYEQRVFFADGPQANQLVHAENGTWLHLVTAPQGQGPLNTPPDIPSPPAPSIIPPQPPTLQIAKQISVPHGNSVLAMGGIAALAGAPDIPNVSALPVGAPPAYDAPYGANVPSNPNVNPNIVLQGALQALSAQGIHVMSTQEISVDSANNGHVSSISFEQRFSSVTRYATTLWLEQLSNGQLMLQYSQNISMQFSQQDNSSPVFPHITANTLMKVM